MRLGLMESIMDTQHDDTFAQTRTIVIFTVVMCSSVLLWFRLSRRSPRTAEDGSSILPPSPWRLPLIGNLHQLTAYPHRGFQALSLKFGPLMQLHLGSVPFCVITSGMLAREVTNTQNAIFSDERTTKGLRKLFPQGDDILGCPDNNIWKLRRKLCVSELLSPKRVKYLHYIREEEVAALIAVLRSSCQLHSEIDLSRLFLELSTNIVSRVVLGLKSSGTADDDAKGKLAMQGIRVLTELFSFEDFIPALAWLDHLTGLNNKLKTTCDDIHAFLDRIINQREIQIRNGNDQQTDKKSLLDVMLELQEKDETIGMGLTRSSIRSILMDLFLAGISSSAATLEWAMAELAKNSRIMKQVQDEVRSIVGQKSEIHEYDIAQMKYMKCVIKETLRLHGATMTARKASKTATVGGFKIPAKTNVIISIWTIHRDPATWDRPLEFLPERFLNTSYNFLGQDGAYFPFSLGKRICPGTHFAISEVELALANVLCWFDWELPAGIQAKDLDMRENCSADAHKRSPLFLVPVPFVSA